MLKTKGILLIKSKFTYIRVRKNVRRSVPDLLPILRIEFFLCVFLNLEFFLVRFFGVFLDLLRSLERHTQLGSKTANRQGETQHQFHLTF